ncbi:MAG: ERCC4 domain-containing protein [Solirubrobacterales bacterium]
MPADTFVVARNPDADSKLPYLLRLPIDDGLELKARETWPATARVYCHPLDGWPADADLIEEVPVRRCARRGRAIDLVLDRSRNNRSQFVFTEPHRGRPNGRSMIFWQTARTAKRARPGQRAPTRRGSGVERLTIEVDSRERYAYRFRDHQVDPRKRALACGDYAVMDGDRVLAVVERKRFEDMVKALVDGSLAYRMSELASFDAAAVVVEERYSTLLAAPRVEPGWIAEVLARLQSRYPQVPIVFADSRKLAEDWTYRFLAAASTS